MLSFSIPNSSPPLLLLARLQGRYIRPVPAYTIDLRLEDNEACDKCKTMALGATWIARHPLEPLHLICIKGCVRFTHATIKQLRVLKDAGVLPGDVYELPTNSDAAWWEWVVGYDCSEQCVKAPKRPRAGEPTPELIDEIIRSKPRLVAKSA